MTLRQLAQDFFESPELQILFMRAATTSTGCFPDDVPGLQGLIHCLPLTLSFEPAAIAVGGSQAITDALVSTGRKLGVEYLASSEVDRITARHGRATGVELSGGARIEADLVVSDLGLGQTVLRLLRDVEIDAGLRRRIANINYDRGQLLWANVAVHEPPRYLAERDNPGVGSQPRLYWGPKDLDYLHLRYQPEIFLGGFAERPYVLCSVDSLWDPTRAPEGRHIVGVEEFSAPRRRFSEGEWRGVKGASTDNVLRKWAGYAPNMTRENVIATRVYTPQDIERERPNMAQGGYSDRQHDRLPARPVRPVPRLTGYRVLLDNVYDCSANLHSGPGIGRGSSYNCYQEIAGALRLGARPSRRDERAAARRQARDRHGRRTGLGREFALHLADLGSGRARGGRPRRAAADHLRARERARPRDSRVDHRRQRPGADAGDDSHRRRRPRRARRARQQRRARRGPHAPPVRRDRRATNGTGCSRSTSRARGCARRRRLR